MSLPWCVSRARRGCETAEDRPKIIVGDWIGRARAGSGATDIQGRQRETWYVPRAQRDDVAAKAKGRKRALLVWWREVCCWRQDGDLGASSTRPLRLLKAFCDFTIHLIQSEGERISRCRYDVR